MYDNIYILIILLNSEGVVIKNNYLNKPIKAIYKNYTYNPNIKYEL